MGKDDVENSGTIKPAFLIRKLVKAYKTLAKEEPAMRTHAARESNPHAARESNPSNLDTRNLLCYFF